MDVREYENRVNSKALSAYPIKNTFCCDRHNPNAKTFGLALAPYHPSTLYSFQHKSFYVACPKQK